MVSGLAAALMASGLLIASGGGAAQGATASKGVGVVSDLTWYMSRSDMDRSIAMMRDAGVQWVRASMTWSNVEPDTKGVLNSTTPSARLKPRASRS